MTPGLLSPARARTVYALADALAPPGPERARGGGDVDVAPAVEARLARAGASRTRATLALLVALEWRPRLAPGGWRGFSWLPRAERLRALARFERSGVGAVRQAARDLRAMVTDALEDTFADHSSPGA